MQVDITSISLQDTGDFYLEVEIGSFHTSGESRFITEFSSPSMTYSVPAEGRDVCHYGEGVTFKANVYVSSNRAGLWIQNEGNGSINLFSNSIIKGGIGGEIPYATGIKAINKTPSTKNIEIYAGDAFGFYHEITAINYGSGDILISSSGTVTGGVDNPDENSKSAGISAWNGTNSSNIVIDANNANGISYGIWAQNE